MKSNQTKEVFGWKNSGEFVGREKPIQKLMESTDANNPMNIAIYGLPHVGKTLLLKEWLRRLEQQNCQLESGRKLLIVKENVAEDSREEGKKGKYGYHYFLKIVLNQMYNTVWDRIEDGFVAEQDDIEAVLLSVEEIIYGDIKDGEYETQILTRLIRALSEQGIRTIFVFDEFERAEKWEEKEYLTLMRLLQDKQLDLFCVVASRPHISYIISEYVQKVSPFEPFLLESFSDEDMEMFFRRILRDGGPNLLEENSKQWLKEILYQCGRNPYLLNTMAEQLSKNPGKSPRKLLDVGGNAVVYTDHFGDVARFMLLEEAKEEKSFSHIVKCYFGTSDDYQDIIGTYQKLGYIEFIQKDSPFAYPDERHVTRLPESKEEYYFTTVCAAFITYLYTNQLRNVKDTRDLLTGLIYGIRDISAYELQRRYHNGEWNRSILMRLYAKMGRDEFYGVELPDGTWECRKLSELRNGFKAEDDTHYPSDAAFLRARRRWIGSHRHEKIEISKTSLFFVIIEFNERRNLMMPVLDPINLTDNGKIIVKYTDIFAPYFKIIYPAAEGWESVLLEHLKILHKYRNKISHFSRDGMSDNDRKDCRKRCIYLLNSMYSYYGNGTEMPACDFEEFKVEDAQEE